MAAQEAVCGELRRVEVTGPGIERIRCGRGFRYRLPCGSALKDAGHLDRIRSLAIPPAWQEVWICTDPAGHIQAVGTDAAGRRQYRYHDRWREQRDAEKFDRVLRLGERMPVVRKEVADRLEAGGLGRERVLSGGLRMLELGAFRVGSEQYAPEDDDSDGSFGLATLRRDHVRRLRGEVRVSYVAKGGVPRELVLRDAAIHRLVGSLIRSKAAAVTEDLLVYRTGRRWHDVRAQDVNAYVKELAGEEFTAKDMRTWNATVLGAVALAGAGREPTKTARKRAVNAAYRAVSEHLGNTPTVARQSYIDPRVVKAFEDGQTIAEAIADASAGTDIREAAEPAVIDLLRRA
jgi:DNA topoisomerase IB